MPRSQTSTLHLDLSFTSQLTCQSVHYVLSDPTTNFGQEPYVPTKDSVYQKTNCKIPYKRT